MDFHRQYWRYRDKSSIKVDIKHPTRFAKLARNQTVYFLSVNLIETETSELIDIPEQYREYEMVFSKENAEILPDEDHVYEIHLVDGKTPPFSPLYPLSATELEVLRNYL